MEGQGGTGRGNKRDKRAPSQLTVRIHSGIKSGAFGGVALLAVIFYASGIPRLQRDVLQKIPFIRGHFIQEIPASDNVRRTPNPISVCQTWHKLGALLTSSFT